MIDTQNRYRGYTVSIAFEARRLLDFSYRNSFVSLDRKSNFLDRKSCQQFLSFKIKYFIFFLVFVAINEVF